MDYQHMGMAALIPGMQFMLDRMQKELDDLRNVLAGLQQKQKETEEPPKDLEDYLWKRKSKTSKGYWAAMTSEQRSAEMRRRAKVAFTKKQSHADGAIDVDQLHPRDARSPRHKKWRKNVRSAQRRRWDNMSQQERTAAIDRMLAARAITNQKKSQHINGRAQ